MLGGSGLQASSRPLSCLCACRGDPNAGDQETFCPSSAGWAPFMRVNPIMDWGYTEVWALLRGARLPYCSLYDKGYTSIGATTNTAQNG